jgi:hypothetical protein
MVWLQRRLVDVHGCLVERRVVQLAKISNANGAPYLIDDAPYALFTVVDIGDALSSMKAGLVFDHQTKTCALPLVRYMRRTSELAIAAGADCVRSSVGGHPLKLEACAINSHRCLL